MKTCTSRLTRHRCVPPLSTLRKFLLLGIFQVFISSLALAQFCVPDLDCSEVRYVLCTDPSAQAVGDPGYTPESTNGCDLELTSVAWVDDLDECSGPFSHRILRTWRHPITNEELCVDTTFVIRLNVESDSFQCPIPVDTFYCGDEENPLLDLTLNAPTFEVEGVDTVALVPGVVGSYCNFSVALDTKEWDLPCPNEKMYTRTWSIHSCGIHIECYDTIFMLDTTPPEAVFNPTLPEADFDFTAADGTEIDGIFKTDTISTSSASCSGSGILPTPDVTNNCGNLSGVIVHITSASNAVSLNYTADDPQPLYGFNIPGEYDVLYYDIRDACGETTLDTVVLVVSDETPATAACHGAVNLNLTNVDEFSFMNAASMDSESEDNCYIYEILARRVDYETACGYDTSGDSAIKDYYDQFAMWVDIDGGICPESYEYGFTREVPFCCEDVGKAIKVELLVIDYNCNVSKCWGMVYVEDKIAPRVADPLEDIYLNCNTYNKYYASYIQERDTQNIRESFGTYVLSSLDQEEFDVITADCDDLTEEYAVTYQDGLVIDNCGGLFRERYTVPELGCVNDPIIREFIAMLSTEDGVVEHVYATQRIFVETCPLGMANITLPVKDTTFFNCGIAYGMDGNTTFETPGPTISEELLACGQYGIGYYDKVFEVITGTGCFKVARTWCIADWCQVDFVGDWIDMAKDPTTFTFVQYIKVKDTLDPVITELDISVQLVSPGCTGIFSAQVDATDNCGVEPDVNWYLRNDNGVVVAQGTGETAAPDTQLDPGSYALLWRATDQCGNIDELVQQFSISADAAPSVITYSSLTAILTPMDTNSNGIVDMGQAEVWAKEFNSSSAPACGGSMDDLIFLVAPGVANDLSPVPSYDATAITFDCSDFSTNPTIVPVQFWVVDTVNDKADYANLEVRLFDNHNVCAGGSSQTTQVGVQGSIMTEAQENVANVKVKASDADGEAAVVTTVTGHYSLEVQLENEAIIKPEKNIEHANGVSTIDLLKLQKHILGVKPLNSPYKMIAADVNNDTEINPIDLILIRKLILGKIDAFPNNTSWRFVDADYRFESHDRALNEVYPEFIKTNGVPSGRKDFIGIKIGDLDGNVVTSRSKARGATEAELINIQDVHFTEGQTIEVPVSLEQLTAMDGMQLAWQFDSEVVQFEHITAIESEISKDEISTSGNSVKISWIDPDLSGAARQHLFTMTFTARKSGKLSDVLALDEQNLTPEFYLDDQKHDLKLTFTQGQDQVLLQNRPNPFRSTTMIGFEVPEATSATIRIFDPAGQILKEIKGDYTRGYNEVIVDRSALTPGILYYELQSQFGKITKRMILIE